MNNTIVSIFELKRVKLLTALFVMVFLVSSAFISIAYLKEYGFTFDYSGAGWAEFLVLFQFPLKAAAAYGAIVGLIGLNHRSVQTKQQLELASSQILLGNEQNKFNNYYKHLEEFEKYVTRFQDKERCLNIDARQAHHAIFPDCLERGGYKVKDEYVKRAFELASKSFSTIILFATRNNATSDSRAYQSTHHTVKAIVSYSCEREPAGFHERFSEASGELHKASLLSCRIMQRLINLIDLIEFDSSMHSKFLYDIKDLLETLCYRFLKDP